MSNSDADRIARRYPRSTAPRWLWIPIACVLGAVLLIWTIWAGVKGANPPVAARIVSFNVVSDTQIDALITVQRTDVNSTVECTATAQAVTYETVGQLPFTWQPTGKELQTEWVSIRTFKRPVTAQVGQCRIVR